jgi:hypothetical protein
VAKCRGYLHIISTHAHCIIGFESSSKLDGL